VKRAFFLGLAIAFLLGVACIVGVPLVLILGFPYTLPYILPPPKSGCDQRQVFAEAESPDGAWVARFYQNACGGGMGTGYVDDTVEITRPGEPPQPVPTTGVVFEMNDYFYDQPKPMTLRWLDDRRLEVTIPNDAWAGRQQETHENLAISYRYLNDDPIERACLKQWHLLPIDEQVRRSMSPKENIKIFLAQCHAERPPH
jgi:hypothetical protein